VEFEWDRAADEMAAGRLQFDNRGRGCAGAEHSVLWLLSGPIWARGVAKNSPIAHGKSSGLFFVEEGRKVENLFYFQKLPMASRVRIIDDTFTLAEGGYIPYEARPKLCIDFDIINFAGSPEFDPLFGRREGVSAMGDGIDRLYNNTKLL
jgi:hypothetical protein